MEGRHPQFRWVDSLAQWQTTGSQSGYKMGLINNQPSAHFTWEEAVITTHREVENILPPDLRESVKYTADQMEIVRGILGVPIHVLSWYRSPELNVAVGGS